MSEVRKRVSVCSLEGTPTSSADLETSPRSGSSVGAVGLAQHFAKQLNRRGVEWCVWKGSFGLNQASGEKDIDLLVSRRDVAICLRVLSELNFTEANGPPPERLPDTRNFFGYDSRANCLVHVHLHEAIVLGHPLKSLYQFPLEKEYLRSCDRRSLFPTPQPEFEFIFFCLRMLLEARGTWSLSGGHSARLSESRQQEYECLREQVSRASTSTLLREHFPYLEPEFFHACSDSLRSASLQEWRRPLRRALRKSRVRSGWFANLKTVCYRGLRTVRIRLLGQRPRRQRILRRGVTVALVGGDGAGKSTLASRLDAWLSPHFDVQTRHLGKPRRSLTTNLIRGGLKVGRAVGEMFRQQPAGSIAAGYSLPLWHFCAARDRYRSFRRTSQDVSHGRIVICDRWPLPQLMSMDGPQIRRITRRERIGGFLKRLADCEQRWHEAISAPDCMVVLKVAPEIAVQRKSEEDAGFVFSRASEVWNAPWSETEAFVVDASQPADAVFSQVKNYVWKRIESASRKQTDN